MGEAFISAKKEKFEHQRDIAVENDFTSENLFSRMPDVSTTEYRCVLTSGDYKPDIGDAVLVASIEAGKVNLLFRNVLVGYVQKGDAEKLQTILAKSSAKMLVASVVSVGKLSRSFNIILNID